SSSVHRTHFCSLSLHDALPIYHLWNGGCFQRLSTSPNAKNRHKGFSAHTRICHCLLCGNHQAGCGYYWCYLFRPSRPGLRTCLCRVGFRYRRSEEHTSELQSRFELVCRLLLEKKNVVCFRRL